MPEAWKTIVPEGKDVIENFSIVGGKIYVKRLHDVKSETSVYTLDGKPAGTIDYDGIGSASGVSGRPTDRYGFFSFESFIQPPTIYRIDTAHRQTRPLRRTQSSLRHRPIRTQAGLLQIKGRHPDSHVHRRQKRPASRMDTERLLMTGYGGFNLSRHPRWNPAWAWWIQQGGWFAVPNMRGGGEYGESWHEQGMFEKKQNVFDDWFAAARYLIDKKYTSPQHFAITGRSNGGLLMGASITQHPELFSAVWCGYPLLDMLRYQKFEQGPHWTTEYGSAESQKQFPYLLKYSPYQNVEAARRLSRRHVLHRRQRHPRRSAARPQNDRTAARRLHQRPPRAAPLQPRRRPLRRRQRRAADSGRCRPACISVDRNRRAGKQGKINAVRNNREDVRNDHACIRA